MRLLSFILLSILIGTVSVSGLIVEGPCRYKEITVMKSLALDSYMGLWYELERYDVPVRQNSDCIKVEMKKTDGEEFDSTETGFNYFEGKDYGVKAHGSVPESGSAKIKYWYDNQEQPQDTNYWVLDTDYNNFSVVWGCENMSDGNSTEYYTMLSRDKKLTSDRDIRKRIMNVVDNAEIDVRYIRITVQEDDVCK